LFFLTPKPNNIKIIFDLFVPVFIKQIGFNLIPYNHSLHFPIHHDDNQLVVVPFNFDEHPPFFGWLQSYPPLYVGDDPSSFSQITFYNFLQYSSSFDFDINRTSFVGNSRNQSILHLFNNHFFPKEFSLDDSLKLQIINDFPFTNTVPIGICECCKFPHFGNYIFYCYDCLNHCHYFNYTNHKDLSFISRVPPLESSICLKHLSFVSEKLSQPKKLRIFF